MKTWLLLTVLAAQQAAIAPANVRFLACTPEYAGGDVALNALKDRIQPVPAPVSTTIQAVVAFAAPSILTGLARARWPRPELALAAAHENAGVMVEGKLLRAQPRGWLAWDCNDPGWTDIRLWIGEAGGSAMVAVVAPAWQQANRAWNSANLRALAKRHARVRVTGWMLYADDDAFELTEGRATLWEIHPVTEIEVSQGGVWKELGAAEGLR